MNRLVGDKIHLSAVSIYYFMCRLHFKFLLIVVVCKGSHNIKFLARFLGFLGFLSLALNGRSYAQCGIAWLRLYQPRQTLPAGTELAKPLKPALRMSCCCVLPLFYSSLGKYNHFFQSKCCPCKVRWRGTG